MNVGDVSDRIDKLSERVRDHIEDESAKQAELAATLARIDERLTVMGEATKTLQAGQEGVRDALSRTATAKHVWIIAAALAAAWVAVSAIAYAGGHAPPSFPRVVADTVTNASR